jgi:hypothetical protein
MAKKYPNIGSVTKRKPQGRCVICGEIEKDGCKPNCAITVQFNWFRGDDEVYKAHLACYQERTEDEVIQAIYAFFDKE